MEYFNKIVCVTYEELLTVIPKGTLNSLLYRGKIQRVDRGGGLPGTAISPYLNATGSALSKSMVIRWS